VKRTLDPVFINEVANHPEVRPWLGGEGEIDTTAIVSNPSHVTLVNEFGGFIFVNHERGVYVAHSQFLPGTGRGVCAAMREAIDFVFTRTDCEKIITQTPDNNAPAIALGRLGGFRTMYRGEHTALGPSTFVGLCIDDWAAGCRALEKDGQTFHDALDAAAAGLGWPEHPEDIVHDRFVGAAFRMAKRGQPAKAVNFYNRWATVAGYEPIRLVSESPVVLNLSSVVTAVVGVRDGEMEILLCR
jgi:hypothetical protein